jgi:heptosyltransferase-1
VARILLIKTSSLGDVVHNLPVVADIRRHRADAVIDWVVEQGFADVPRLHPHVNTVIPVATRLWRKALLNPSTWSAMRDFRRELRAHEYDVVLDTQGLVKSALITHLARGPKYGQDARSAREPLAARFYDHGYAVARGRHAVVRNRDLAAQALGYPMPETPPDYGIRAPTEALPFALPEPCVVCLHATSRDDKLWPEPDWVTLATRFGRAGLHTVLPWGNDAELARARRIGGAVSGAIVLPRLGLRALATVLGKARAVVGVDTGLVHLAVALGRPTAALYTATDPTLTGVYGDASRALNLGSVGNTPSVADVEAALARLGLW